jgi:hypothetical protein
MLKIHNIPSSVKTVDDWVDVLLPRLVSLPKDFSFSTPLEFPKLSKARAAMGERVFRCLWLVWMSKEITQDYYPEDPEQTINFELEKGKTTWNDISVVKKYVNTRLKNVFDPEFLVLLWSKQLENFDSNDMALLPTYPKDFYNRPFRPHEIRDVVRQLQFSNSSKSIQAPALLALVEDPFGYQVLETVYTLLTVPKQEMRGRLEQFKKQHPPTQPWKVGFHFMGMSEPLLRPECLLTEYLLSRFFYIPPRHILNLFSIDDPTQYFLEKLQRDTAPKHPLYVLDMDPKTMKTVKKPQYFWFHDKKTVRAYAHKVGKPNYFLFLEDMNQLFKCKVF